MFTGIVSDIGTVLELEQRTEKHNSPLRILNFVKYILDSYVTSI